MERRRTTPTIERLNKIAREHNLNSSAPATGITSSAEQIAFAIDAIAMQTINSCAIKGSEFHIKTHDMVNAVVARIQGTPTK